MQVRGVQATFWNFYLCKTLMHILITRILKKACLKNNFIKLSTIYIYIIKIINISIDNRKHEFEVGVQYIKNYNVFLYEIKKVNLNYKFFKVIKKIRISFIWKLKQCILHLQNSTDTSVYLVYYLHNLYFNWLIRVKMFTYFNYLILW